MNGLKRKKMSKLKEQKSLNINRQDKTDWKMNRASQTCKIKKKHQIQVTGISKEKEGQGKAEKNTERKKG